MGWMTEESGLDFRQRKPVFRVYKAFRPALGTTNPPTQWAPRIFLHSLASSAEVKNAWGYTSTPIHTAAACTGAALLFSLIFRMRATCPSRGQTIMLLTHYCEEYLDVRKIKGGTWREWYGMNLGPSGLARLWGRCMTLGLSRFIETQSDYKLEQIHSPSWAQTAPWTSSRWHICLQGN